MKFISILFSLALFTTLATSLLSCTKDKIKTKSDLLTNHAWKQTSDLLNGFETLSDCDKDDVFTFQTNGMVERNYGADQCAPPEVTESFAWSLSSDEKILTIDGVPFTIVTFTESSLVLSVTDGSTVDFVTWAPN